MRENTLKKACSFALLLILLVVALVFMTKSTLSVHALGTLSPTTNTQTTASSLLEMKDEECIDCIVGNGIEIPEDFINSPELGNIIKSILQDIETNPNHEFAFSYYKTQVFAESIRELVINQSIISQSQGTSTNSSTIAIAAYALQDNTQFGSWQSNYPNYNYSYLLNRQSKG